MHIYMKCPISCIFVRMQGPNAVSIEFKGFYLKALN